MFKSLINIFKKSNSTEVALPVSEVQFVESSELADRVYLFCSSYKGLMRTVDHCLSRHKGDGGWIHCVHGHGVESYLYDDDYDMTAVRVLLKGELVYELKHKHGQMWIRGAGIPAYMEDHPRAQTFGVFRYTPISTKDDVDKLPENIKQSIYVLADRYGKSQ